MMQGKMRKVPCCTIRPVVAPTPGRIAFRPSQGWHRSVCSVDFTKVCEPCHRFNMCCASQRDDLPDVSGLAMAKRFASEFQQREVQANFDGRTLATLIQKKFGRSYDVILVQRKLMGKVFVAMNIMWRYLEQQSFTKSEEQYINDLDVVASVLNSWGVVKEVAAELQGVKSRPRVGKAVSILLNVDPDKLAEWVKN